MHDFEVSDKVRFIGRDAADLRAEGRCTTGVIVPDAAEGSPYVVVELDLEEEAGKGGGAVLRLAAFNWSIIGEPIVLSLRGKQQRHLERLLRMREEMITRPVELQNPIILGRLEQKIAEYSN